MSGVLLLLLACGSGESGADLDHDGFVSADDGGDDCDDGDAFVHPGAPDDPADGVDADCDGVDPEHAFVGDWEIVAMVALYSGFDAFEDEGQSGTLSIDSDLAADLDIVVPLDPALVGYELDVPFIMEGWASPTHGDGAAHLYLSGDLFDEQSSFDWECVASDDELACTGALKALEVNFLADASFTRL